MLQTQKIDVKAAKQACAFITFAAFFGSAPMKKAQASIGNRGLKLAIILFALFAWTG
jgi:hypothetical protein